MRVSLRLSGDGKMGPQINALKAATAAHEIVAANLLNVSDVL